MKTIILGAGFTGLAAGIKTGAPIYEATDKAGGICNSYIKEGFHFFNGGPHLLFGRGVGLDYIKSLVPVNEYEKKAGVYYNKMFPYPIQTTAQQPNTANPGTFKAWVGEKFSQAECNLFFNPFNEKYTAGLYNEVIQYDDYKTPPAGSKGFVSTFCDPVNGLDDLVEKMANQCQIKYNKRAVRVDADNKTIELREYQPNEVSVDFIQYDKLISTIPLNQILSMCGKNDSDLPYTSVLVLNIGAEPDVCTPKEHWVYTPFCKTNFHRLSFYSNIDPAKAPAGKVNLSVEMAFRNVKYDDLDLDYICYHVVQELQSWRFIGKTITVDPTWVETGYTWLYKKEDQTNALAWLKERDIISTGRYGKWHFQGLVDSIKDGFEVQI